MKAAYAGGDRDGKQAGTDRLGNARAQSRLPRSNRRGLLTAAVLVRVPPIFRGALRKTGGRSTWLEFKRHYGGELSNRTPPVKVVLASSYPTEMWTRQLGKILIFGSRPRRLCHFDQLSGAGSKVVSAVDKGRRIMGLRRSRSSYVLSAVLMSCNSPNGMIEPTSAAGTLSTSNQT